MSLKKKLLLFSIGLALILVMLLIRRHLREQHRQRRFEAELTNLHDPDSKVRSNAIQILRDAGKDKLQIVVPALIPLLRDEDANVRLTASDTLYSIGSTEDVWSDERRVAEALPVLVGAMKDGHRESQHGASQMLVAIGEPAIPPLIEALHNNTTSSTAREALGQVGKVAIPALIETLKEGRDVRIQVVHALREIGRDAAEPLLQALRNSSDTATRAGAASALGYVGQGVEGVIPALMAALKDENDDVKSEVGVALVCIGEEAGPPLLDAMENDVELRSRAASILSRNGPCLSEAVPTLVDLLRNHEDPSVRQSAAQVLRQSYGEKEVPGLVEKGVPALIEALQDEDTHVRRYAALAFGEIQHDVSETVPALVAVLKNDASRTVQSCAAIALGMIGSDAREAVMSLVDKMQNDPQLGVRGQAAQALGKIGPDAGEAVAPLINAFQNDESQLVRANAATALGRIGTSAKEAIPLLKEGCSDGSPMIQGRCALALWTLGIQSAEMRPGLQYATRYDVEPGDPEIREAARKALKEMQDAANAAAPAEEEVIDHSGKE